MKTSVKKELERLTIGMYHKATKGKIKGQKRILNLLISIASSEKELQNLITNTILLISKVFFQLVLDN